jgi:hypothetical protein
MCLAGEACAAGSGACGACVLAGIVAGTRGIGEPCELDTECRSGTCYDDDGVHYCSASCAADSDCLSTFHCRSGLCARGPRGAIGAACLGNEDCAMGLLCAVTGDASWCTSFCDTTACPDGFDCVSAGGAMVCAPARGLVGQSCMVGEDCVSGLCVDAGHGPVCTEICGPMRTCFTGFECVRATDGVNGVCVAPAPPPEDGGGCVVAPSASSTPTFALGLFSSVLALAWMRRRRRR